MQRLRMRQQELGVTPEDADIVMLGQGCTRAWEEFQQREQAALKSGRKSKPALRFGALGTTFLLMKKVRGKNLCYEPDAAVFHARLSGDPTERWVNMPFLTGELGRKRGKKDTHRGSLHSEAIALRASPLPSLCLNVSCHAMRCIHTPSSPPAVHLNKELGITPLDSAFNDYSNRDVLLSFRGSIDAIGGNFRHVSNHLVKFRKNNVRKLYNASISGVIEPTSRHIKKVFWAPGTLHLTDEAAVADTTSPTVFSRKAVMENPLIGLVQTSLTYLRSHFCFQPSGMCCVLCKER